MNNKYINSRILFYIPEIIIFCFYFVIYYFASIIEQGFLLSGLVFGIVSYIFFVIEHRTDLLFDKINNIMVVREKMLFINKYIIKKQCLLSDILGAETVTLTNYDNKDKTKSITYKLKLSCKNGNVIFPFGSWSGSNQQEWQSMVDKINRLSQSQEPTLIISRKPFFLRLCFGLSLGFFYFFVGFGIIFPKEMEPIIYHILNVLFSINGYHQ